MVYSTPCVRPDLGRVAGARTKPDDALGDLSDLGRARAMQHAAAMWIYAHVDGEVQDFFDGAMPRLEELQRRWDDRPEGLTLGDHVEKVKAAIAAMGTLVAYEAADEPARLAARTGYFATLELACFLDHHDGYESLDRVLQDATFAVQDLLEEWAPYISHADAAQNLVRLDGVSPEEALASTERDRATPDRVLDDDCPLCRMLAAEEARYS
jgi:hypothetical protein